MDLVFRNVESLLMKFFKMQITLKQLMQVKHSQSSMLTVDMTFLSTENKLAGQNFQSMNFFNAVNVPNSVASKVQSIG